MHYVKKYNLCYWTKNPVRFNNFSNGLCLFKQQLGDNAIAIRIGEINRETEFILNMFNEFAPPLVQNIRTRVRDIILMTLLLVSLKIQSMKL